jgi:hypothetical protein
MNPTLIVAAHFCLLAPSQPVAMGSRVGPAEWLPSIGAHRVVDLGGLRRHQFPLVRGLAELGSCINKRFG